MSTPVITVTDLYHPPEDPGDNFDLVMPFGLDRVDLRAVILDVSIEKRESVSEGVPGYPGPRDPGVIPVTQLNTIFGRRVPFGIGPFARMRSLDDPMTDVPAFQQAGIELLIETLRESDEPVHLMSFGSARPIAVAFNRAPEVFREKVARVHLSAGSTSLDYLEWNVYLDPLAMIRVVESGLPLSLYPCATEVDCFSYGRHNTLWWLDDLGWIADMHPALRRYLTYGLGGSTRVDFLRALDDDAPDDVSARVYRRRHAVWETAAWIEASDSALVRHADGTHEIIGRDAHRPRRHRDPERAAPLPGALASVGAVHVRAQRRADDDDDLPPRRPARVRARVAGGAAAALPVVRPVGLARQHDRAAAGCHATTVRGADGIGVDAAASISEAPTGQASAVARCRGSVSVHTTPTTTRIGPATRAVTTHWPLSRNPAPKISTGDAVSTAAHQRPPSSIAHTPAARLTTRHSTKSGVGSENRVPMPAPSSARVRAPRRMPTDAATAVIAQTGTRITRSGLRAGVGDGDDVTPSG